MENKVKINPNERFDTYKEKFNSIYMTFIDKIEENLKLVDYHTERLNCSIVPLCDPEKLRHKLEDNYNYTNNLIEVLTPMISDKKIKHLHFFSFDKKYSDIAKKEEATFQLIKEMYKNFALATRWEATMLHHSHIDKATNLKWTKNTINKISNDRIDLTGKNNSKHSLFKSTLDIRESQESR